MNILDTIVYSIWFEESHKYERVSVGTRNRICGGLYMGLSLAGLIALILTCAFGSAGLTVQSILICCVVMLIASVPRLLITAPPEIAIREEYIRCKTQVPIRMQDLQSGETTNMLYNSVYNQGVVYTEDGMKIVDLPFHTYNKTWVAFDSDQ